MIKGGVQHTPQITTRGLRAETFERYGVIVEAGQSQPRRHQVPGDELGRDPLPGWVLPVARGADHARQVRLQRLPLLIVPAVVQGDGVATQHRGRALRCVRVAETGEPRNDLHRAMPVLEGRVPAGVESDLVERREALGCDRGHGVVGSFLFPDLR